MPETRVERMRRLLPKNLRKAPQPVTSTAHQDDRMQTEEQPPPVEQPSHLPNPRYMTVQPVAPLNCLAPMMTQGEEEFRFDDLTKFCYKFVPSQWLQPLATAFFDQDKIYRRGWDLYYIPPCSYCAAVAFISEHQLASLIDDINKAFPTASITADDYLFIDFDDLDNSLRPRWAGRCTSRALYNSLLNKLAQQPAMVLPTSSDRSLEAFKAKMDAAADLNRAKGKAHKAKKQQETVFKRQSMVKETSRAQRYLGLLPKNDGQSPLPDISTLSVTSMNPTKPSPYAFDLEPILIAIDCEAYEHPPRVVTEIGIATLDTRDLKGHAPGDVGQNWHQYIRGRHFRIIEHKHRVNRDFVQGCPDSFEFGESEHVGEKSIGNILASCFRDPYSGKSNPPEGQVNTTGEKEKRNIIIVGHDLGQDVRFCREAGFNLFDRSSIIDSLDTANMYRAYTNDPSPRSLGSILYDFDLTGWNLHNAGNDAVYTLHALLAIALKRGSKEADQKIAETRETLAEAAKERAEEAGQGWRVDGDGGDPTPPSAVDYLPKPKGRDHGGAGGRRMGGGGDSALYTVGGAPLDV